jgi:hypothetical protein
MSKVRLPCLFEDSEYLTEQPVKNKANFRTVNCTRYRVCFYSYCIKGKGKAALLGLECPRGFQEVKVPRFLDSGTGWW